MRLEDRIWKDFTAVARQFLNAFPEIDFHEVAIRFEERYNRKHAEDWYAAISTEKLRRYELGKMQTQTRLMKHIIYQYVTQGYD